jgi:hypothetical protein
VTVALGATVLGDARVEVVGVVVAEIAEVAVTVPVPGVMLEGDGVRLGEFVAVGGSRVRVGTLVAVMTNGVLLGSRVGVGMDSTVCATCAATVA